MQGLSAYRGAYATYAKKAAQRCHRHRVTADLKLVARQAMAADDFEDDPGSPGESMDSWDIC